MSTKPSSSPMSPTKPRRSDGDLVQSLTRALTLLEILGGQACRLTELAQRAQLPLSTTHRLLTTLEQKRFVRFDREESLWSIGSHCFSIGAGYVHNQDVFKDAIPKLERLANDLGATVNLGILESGNLLLVRQSAKSSPSPAQPPGTNFPLHATAMGKILLARAEDQAQLQGLMAKQLKRLTNSTICNPTELAKELRNIRMRGIAMDNEESMPGRRCLAAPLHNQLGQCVAAISITSSCTDMTDTALNRLAAALIATAGDISRTAGGSVSKHYL